MGSDREARIVGAAETIEVGGKEYKLRPVSVQHLCDLQREALRHYKRQYLETYHDSADLLGNGKALMEQKIQEVARWTVRDLPQMDVFDVSKVPLTPKIVGWLEKNFDDLPESEDGKRAILSNSLDVGMLSPDDLKNLSGRGPVRGKVRYDQWWVTAIFEGMVRFILSSIRIDHPEVTMDVISGWPISKIAEASRKVESVATADLGNT